MKHTSIIVAIGFALAAMLSAVPAMALNGRTFVSPTGSDSNPCTLALPCRNLQAALAQTNPGGEIAVLDTAGYSGGATLTIDRAISIVNPGAFEAGISPPSGGIGIVINAGATDAVSLRGLTIEGAGAGLHGIQFNTGKSLTIENCVIRHVTGEAINFIPNATSSLSVSSSLLADNGDAGIWTHPTGSGVVTAVLNRVELNNNGNNGFIMDGGGSTGTLKATVSDSVASGNGDTGFAAVTNTAPTTMMLYHSVAANNNGNGVGTHGTGATLRIANSIVTGNTNGWVVGSVGSSVLSAGDNTIEDNTANETAPPKYTLK